eukprot:TRINITY_DN32372_c0_g1_i1.p1 TRINITY_DN32372_c0_g1~~TRINITY_DN32372_c0_g1_i1.p1  ORF type:complete len:175 (-),score=27.05 TRINITY_DN32372_c0_g1_i1:136-660(-)
MSFDMGFAIQFAQRIEKEERAFLTGALEKQAKEKAERRALRRSERRSHSSAASNVSGPLSVAGDSVAGSSVYSASSSGSRMNRSASESGINMDGVPDHLKACMHFPVVDKDIMTARVSPTLDGTVPKFTLKPEQKKAMWWPGRGSYTQYNPSFSFAPPPEWTPDDILKDNRSRR